MRKPPPIQHAREFPATVVLGLLAIGTSIACWTREPLLARLTTDVRAFHGEPWRLITSALPHGDVLHLGFNVAWLWTLGTAIEEKLGSRALIVMSLVFALFSGTADYALSRSGIGLSGVVYGYFALLWVLSRRDERFARVIDRSTIRLFVGWFVFCVVATRLGWLNIGNVAHAAGALAGALLGYALTTTRARHPLFASIALLTVAAIVAGYRFRAYVNLSGDAGNDASYLGYTAFKDGRNEDAARWMREAVAIAPKVADHWYNLAVVEAALGDRAASVEHFRRAIALAPDDPKYREALKWAEEER